MPTKYCLIVWILFACICSLDIFPQKGEATFHCGFCREGSQCLESFERLRDYLCRSQILGGNQGWRDKPRVAFSRSR